MLKGVEVHVVVTARDPARQAVAEWQEGIKHGRRLTFEQFRGGCSSSASETDYARRFRASQDLPDVLARWGARCRRPACTSSAARRRTRTRRLLWQRFAERRRVRPRRLPARRAGQREPVAGHHRDRPAAPGQRRPRQAARAAGLRPGRQAALRPGAARAGPLAPSGRPARDVRRPARSSASGGPRRSTRRGTTCAATWPSLVPVAPAEPGPHPDDVTRRRPGGLRRRRDRRAAARGAAGPRRGGPARGRQRPAPQEAQAAQAAARAPRHRPSVRRDIRP